MPTSLSFPSQHSGDSSRHCLIFHITGNPGLIDYYEPFLSTLRSLIDDTETEKSIAFHIEGRNLLGFADDDHDPFTSQNQPFGLEAQIKTAYNTISSLRIPSGPRKGDPFDDIVLMGHSVGTYITLELFHRHQQDPSRAPHVKLKAAILLFATITHLSQSPRGRKAEVLIATPFLGQNMHLLAKAFLSLVPSLALTWILRHLMGFPPHAAATTHRMLTSRDGVWQALHLAKDEMATITEDRWTDDLWEVVGESASNGKLPKFFIFFGKDDQWVANEHRNRFIERRKLHVNGRTRIEVDEGNLPHDFCIHHSEILAEKVKVWIDEIAESLTKSETSIATPTSNSTA